jgi:hypothetical protein
LGVQDFDEVMMRVKNEGEDDEGEDDASGD